MMAWLTACVVFMLAVFTEVNSQITPVYEVSMVNCDRTGMACQTTSTDTTCDDAVPAECVCSDSYQHVSDKIKHICLASPEACADATKECKNDGVCYKDGSGVDTCYCTQGYTGDDCSTQRVTVKCFADKIEVTVAPYGDFQGKISTLDNLEDPKCELTAGTLKTFTYADPDSCGVKKTAPEGEDKTTKNVLEVIIRYDKNILKTVDQVLILTCIFDPENTQSELLIKDTFLPNVLDNDKVDELAQILITKMFKGDAELNTPDDYNFNVGETIKIEQTLEIPNSADYKTMKMKSAVVKQSETATAEEAMITLVEDGCVKSSPVKSSITVSAEANKITLELKAFVFLTALFENKNTLFFVITYEMCTDAAPCVQKTKAECATPVARRRRSATSDNEVTVTKSVFVRLGNNTIEEELDEKQVGAADMDRCLKNPALQAVVAVMGLLLFALLLALIIVVFVVCRRSNRRGNKFMNDDRSTTSSTQKLDMQIPRPRV